MTSSFRDIIRGSNFACKFFVFVNLNYGMSIRPIDFVIKHSLTSFKFEMDQKCPNFGEMNPANFKIRAFPLQQNLGHF